MAPKAMTPTSNELGPSGMPGRRRRTLSKDSEADVTRISPQSSRFNFSPSNRSHPNSPLNHDVRRRRTRHSNLRKFITVTFDLVMLAYLFLNSRQFFSSPTTEVTQPTSNTPTYPIPIHATESKNTGVLPVNFERYLRNTPVCEKVLPAAVSYTLALQLSDDLLWMMEHQCALWGELAPISLAMWTAFEEHQIRSKLQQMGCNLDAITLQTISSGSQSLEDYPINKLRNMALTAVATSHVLLLDIDMFPSIDLFDTLNLPQVRKILGSDSKLAMVIPSFETLDLNCGSSNKCRDRNLWWMPKDFEDLVIELGNKKVLPYDPTHFSRQGSTNYRQWMKQDTGELLEIPCVSSDQYQPYLVVRLCDALPPFQEQFIGHGRNNMSWMMHLRRTGYSLKQLGGAFVTQFPHVKSQAHLEWEKSGGSQVDRSTHLRVRTDTSLSEFEKWMETSLADESRVNKCDDFEADDKGSWILDTATN